MSNTKTIVMMAAENDALPDGKVGGIGDVIRDVPVALARAGHCVHVVTPGYQYFSTLSGASYSGQLRVEFKGHAERVDVYKIRTRHSGEGVNTWVLEHPLFAAGGPGVIYCNDPDTRPFATDASKFALFCAAAGVAIMDGVFDRVDVLHLHDWHAATLAVLRAYDPAYESLKSLRTVFSIHNLALQGVRPFDGNESALKTWFPKSHYPIEMICDPRVRHCYNPMRAGVNLCDKVHAVSPTYAREIVQPGNTCAGRHGGEGLELDLKRAESEGRLFGILNGAEYHELSAEVPDYRDLLRLCEQEVEQLAAKDVNLKTSHWLAARKLGVWQANHRRPQVLMTSVGRITAQKVTLLQQSMPSGISALDILLEMLEGYRGQLIMVGSGDAKFERFFVEVAARHDNFLFIQGYAQLLVDPLYQAGDLFLMPSSFEPCGISQMLAMRAGQPCLVHHTGGLADTVIDNFSGFQFSGNTLQEQAMNMLVRLEDALRMHQSEPERWQKICANAAAQRFEWSKAASEYTQYLYN